MEHADKDFVADEPQAARVPSAAGAEIGASSKADDSASVTSAILE